MRTKVCLLTAATLGATGIGALAQPVITVQPLHQTNAAGTAAIFSVGATGVSPLSYQWRSYASIASFTNIPGANVATLTLSNVQPTSRQFAVEVSNPEGAVTSVLARLVVLRPPSITAQPSNVVADIGATATFTVTATGTAPLLYQWYFDNMPLAHRTNASLMLTTVQPTNSGGYKVVVSNAAGAVTSEVAVLRVGPTPHGFDRIQALADRTISVALAGTVPAMFAWYYDLYPLDVSTNLADWHRVATLLATNSSAEAPTWSEREASRFDQRFYRTVTNHLPTPFPAPTGPYPVGTFSRVFTDPSRTNRYNIPTNSSFMVSIWYPAQTSTSRLPGPYVDLPIARYSGWFGPYVDRAPLFKAHSLPDAPLAANAAKFPVVLFSHGANSVRSYLPEKAEELASHGFVVLAMDHIQAVISVFPDGTVVYGSFSPQPAHEHGVRDVLFVMDELSRLNTTDPFFAGRLDLEKIGALGSSFGGGVVSEVCRIDSRCKAVFFLDAALYAVTNLQQLTLRQPFLCAVSSVNPGFQGWVTDTKALFDRATANAYWF